MLMRNITKMYIDPRRIKWGNEITIGIHVKNKYEEIEKS